MKLLPRKTTLTYAEGKRIAVNEHHHRSTKVIKYTLTGPRSVAEKNIINTRVQES